MNEVLRESLEHKSYWTIKRYANDEDLANDKPYDISTFEGNLLLNEGIQLLEDLLIVAGGTGYNNASAYLGVGDSTTAAVATQTALQAATNKKFVAMDAAYPSRTDQTITWRATFASADANFAWQEFTLVNAADDTGTNLNRKVSDQGTKVSGETYVLSLTLVIS